MAGTDGVLLKFKSDVCPMYLRNSSEDDVTLMIGLDWTNNSIGND